MDLRPHMSVPADGRLGSEPRVAAAVAGVAGGACGGDGAGRRRNTMEVRIMTKSRTAPRSKLAGKQASKISRKPTAPRDIREHDTVSAAAREKTGGEASVPAAPARSSKKATILALLQRPTGAAIGDLTEATGWQGHSVRPALTGPRNEGNELGRGKGQGGVTHYRLAAAACGSS